MALFHLHVTRKLMASTQVILLSFWNRMRYMRIDGRITQTSKNTDLSASLPNHICYQLWSTDQDHQTNGTSISASSMKRKGPFGPNSAELFVEIPSQKYSLRQWHPWLHQEQIAVSPQVSTSRNSLQDSYCTLHTEGRIWKKYSKSIRLYCMLGTNELWFHYNDISDQWEPVNQNMIIATMILV